MALFKQKRPTMTRQQLLQARPIRNPRAEVTETDQGDLDVAVPFEKPKGLTWFFRGRKTLLRRFQLDQLGRKVWNLCDGQHTVRQLIERFSRDEGLNLREAEVSMLTYLETLGKRGIIFMAGEPPTQRGS
ncbi:MAG TPA: PqqD family protein [Phycisphaerae bacterium]|nr:PqqD family protein [Phycisphaerae bacterium]